MYEWPTLIFSVKSQKHNVRSHKGWRGCEKGVVLEKIVIMFWEPLWNSGPLTIVRSIYHMIAKKSRYININIYTNIDINISRHTTIDISARYYSIHVTLYKNKVYDNYEFAHIGWPVRRYSERSSKYICVHSLHTCFAPSDGRPCVKRCYRCVIVAIDPNTRTRTLNCQCSTHIHSVQYTLHRVGGLHQSKHIIYMYLFETREFVN